MVFTRGTLIICWFAQYHMFSRDRLIIKSLYVTLLVATTNFRSKSKYVLCIHLFSYCKERYFTSLSYNLFTISSVSCDSPCDKFIGWWIDSTGSIYKYKGISISSIGKLNNTGDISVPVAAEKRNLYYPCLARKLRNTGHKKIKPIKCKHVHTFIGIKTSFASKTQWFGNFRYLLCTNFTESVKTPSMYKFHRKCKN